MARKFLYFIAAIIVLILIGLVVFRLFGMQLARIAFVPSEAFKRQAAFSTNVYERADMWVARPGLASNPAAWRPKGFSDTSTSDVAVFFIHPTSYISGASWNAPLDAPETNERTRIFVRGQASVFNASPNIWAPKYRQASIGAFLTDKPEGRMALDAAYRDVLMAFDVFLAAQGPDAPIVLAGHSQGALHLVQLLKDRVAGKPLADRIVAAYPIGWPISIEADLPALGLPACASPDQSGCIMTWQAFAEPADYEEIVTAFDAAPSLTGKPRAGGKLLCNNPAPGGVAANRGVLKNKMDFSDGELIPATFAARCDDKGFLLIGDGPGFGMYVLPGNNYHVFDYSLFWANLRINVAKRTEAFRAR